MTELAVMNVTTVTPSLQYDCAGVLCGSCRNGYGVSVLLNKCVTCHDASGILIAVLGESQKIAYYSLGVLWLNVTLVLQFY